MDIAKYASFPDIDDILRKVGEPLGDSSIIPTWKLSNTASSKVTVILSGDGADETLFLDETPGELLKKIRQKLEESEK